MYRRSFLAIGTGTASVALAGCIGYEITDSDELESQEERIETQSTQIGELEEENEELKQDLEGFESDIEDLESRRDELEAQRNELDDDYEELQSDLEAQAEAYETDLRELEVEAYVSYYQHATDVFDEGREGHDYGLNALSEEDAIDASRAFAIAAGYFDSAQYLFQMLSEWAEDNDDEIAVDIASASADNVFLLREMSLNHSIGAELYHHGLENEALSYLEEGDSYLDQAEWPESPTEFENEITQNG